jgi:hypothetical protein
LLLHEATHHWCFDTPLFYALFLFQFRALGGLWKIAEGQQVNQFDIADDIYRFRTVIDLYRPIIEGLATFAEYAALPQGRFTYSHPFSQMLVMSASWLSAADAKVGGARATKMLLTIGRSNRAQIRKKAGMLSMPFDPARSPYLTGHLLMCSMWRAISSRRVELMVNTDAFLSYMRSYFFFDYELIDILMNNDLHEGGIVEAVAQHLLRRILQLINPDLSILLALRESERRKDGQTFMSTQQKYSKETLEKALREWDANDEITGSFPVYRVEMRRTKSWFRPAGISGLDQLFGPLKGVLNDDQVTARAQKSLLSAYNWLLPADDDRDMVLDLKNAAFMHLQQRSLLALCRADVQATIEGRKCIVVWKDRKFGLVAAADARPGSHAARLEVVMSARMLDPLLYVYADGRVIGAGLPKEFGNAARKALADMRGATELQRFVDILTRVTTLNAIVSDGYVPILVEGYEQAIGGAVDEVYDRAFMALFPRTDWAAARAKMKERGLVGFEGASFAAVRGLARLSQSPCTPISDKGWNNLIELIRQDGDSPDPVDEAMRYFGPESRLPLIGKANGYWMGWI